MKKILLFCCLFLLAVGAILFINYKHNQQNDVEINQQNDVVQTVKLDGFDVMQDGFSFPNYSQFKGLTPKIMAKLFEGEYLCSNAEDLDEECILTPQAKEWMDRVNSAKKQSFQDLDNVTMQALFNPESVCSQSSAKELGKKNCILTPQAKQWMDTANLLMQDGHCEGMAVLSLLLYEERIKGKDCEKRSACLIPKLSPNAKNAYDIPFNSEVQKEIAYWYATQFTFPTKLSEEKPKNYEKLVDDLKKSFEENNNRVKLNTNQSQKDKQPDYYTLALYWEGGSHLVTPYKIEEKKKSQPFFNKKYVIWVYDNSSPGEEIALEIDNPEKENKSPIYPDTREGEKKKGQTKGGKKSKSRGSVIVGEEITSMTLIKNTYRESTNTLFSVPENQVWAKGGDIEIEYLKKCSEEELKSAQEKNERTPCYSKQESFVSVEDDRSSVYNIPDGKEFKFKVSNTEPEENTRKRNTQNQGININMIGKSYYFVMKNIELTSNNNWILSIFNWMRSNPDSNSKEHIVIEFNLKRKILTFENQTKQKQNIIFSGGFPIDRGPDYELVQLNNLSLGAKTKLEINLNWEKEADWYKQFLSLKVSEAKEDIKLGQLIVKRRRDKEKLDSFSTQKSKTISLKKGEQVKFLFGLMPEDIPCFPLQKEDKSGKNIGEVLLVKEGKKCDTAFKNKAINSAINKLKVRKNNPKAKTPEELNETIKNLQQAIGLKQLQSLSSIPNAPGEPRSDDRQDLQNYVEQLWEKIQSENLMFWDTVKYWNTVTSYWHSRSEEKGEYQKRYEESLQAAVMQVSKKKKMEEKRMNKQDSTQANRAIKEFCDYFKVKPPECSGLGTVN